MLVDMFSYDIPCNLRQNIVPCIIDYIESGYFTLSPYSVNRLQRYEMLEKTVIENNFNTGMIVTQDLINQIEYLKYGEIMDRATVRQFEKMIKCIGGWLTNKNITAKDAAYHTIADEIFKYFGCDKYQNIPSCTINQMQQTPYYANYNYNYGYNPA